MPRNEIAGVYGNSIFSFLRNPILFPIIAAPIHFHQQCGSLFSTLTLVFTIYRHVFSDDGHTD